MQQHLHLLEGWRGGAAKNANQKTPAGPLALVAQLERLLGERQDLVAQLDALRSRLDQLADEQERLVADLQALLPPEGNPLV